MLDQLRAMGVFACVVKQNSFSGAARELGITTSAVSQQIRSLEQEMDATLLYRSTRRISLTEEGQVFYQSCKEMLAAAERGKIRMNELRDDLIGELRIATTPELAANHIIPALSQWLFAHSGLSVKFEADTQFIDLQKNDIDVALRMAPKIEDTTLDTIPLARVEQVLVASAEYLNQTASIHVPEDLKQHSILPVHTMQNWQHFSFYHHLSDQCVELEMKSRISTNNIFVVKALCQNGLGLARVLYLDVQKELISGELIEVLPDWKLPSYTLYAVAAPIEQRSVKTQRCIDALKTYFSQIPGGRLFKEAS
ncbi:LysR family transcriptional regulator [Acinetobacter sp. MB5]|uniref:LysR family transcriptional regulator n=1 Tax=Acinetobacter sp. MB5 TaxID=2069438 RepID=UPI000DD0959C|nr:LysR family transcriptional regulator [Acinetobacter sp. MB5]